MIFSQHRQLLPHGFKIRVLQRWRNLADFWLSSLSGGASHERTRRWREMRPLASHEVAHSFRKQRQPAANQTLGPQVRTSLGNASRSQVDSDGSEMEWQRKLADHCFERPPAEALRPAEPQRRSADIPRAQERSERSHVASDPRGFVHFRRFWRSNSFLERWVSWKNMNIWNYLTMFLILQNWQRNWRYWSCTWKYRLDPGLAPHRTHPLFRVKRPHREVLDKIAAWRLDER